MTDIQEVNYFHQADRESSIFPERFIVDVDTNPEAFYDRFFGMGYLLLDHPENQQGLKVKEGDEILISNFKIYPPNCMESTALDRNDLMDRYAFTIPFSACNLRMDKFRKPYPDSFFMDVNLPYPESQQAIERLGLYKVYPGMKDWLSSALQKGRTSFYVENGDISPHYPESWSDSLLMTFAEGQSRVHLDYKKLSHYIEVRDFFERHLSDSLLANKETFPTQYYLRLDGDMDAWTHIIEALGLKQAPEISEVDLMNTYPTPHTYFRVKDTYFYPVREGELQWPVDFVNEESPVLSLNQLFQIKMREELKDIRGLNQYQFAGLLYVTERNYPYTSIPARLGEIPKENIDEILCYYAVRNQPENIQHVPAALLSDRVLEANLTSATPYVYDPMALSRLFSHLKEDALLKTVEHFPMFLQYVEEEFQTKAVCEKAVEKDLFALLYVPVKIRDEEFCKNAVKPRLSELEPIHLSLLQTVYTHPHICHAISENVEKNLLNKPELSVLSDFPEHYFNIPVKYRSTELDIAALKNKPELFLTIPLDERTPEVCLYMKMNHYSLCIRNAGGGVPEHISQGTNLYTFAGELKKYTSDPLSFDQVRKIYDGAPVRVSSIKIKGETFRDRIVRWDKDQNFFSVSNELDKKKERTTKKRPKL